MKFYHISLDLENDIKAFKPTIPNEEIRLCNEDSTTPRICVSNSIEGCLSAVPWGGIDFENQFDTDHIVFKVYEFEPKDILNGNLIKPDYLYKEDLVRDAKFTGEHWIVNQELKPIKSYLAIVNINDYEETSEDDISFEELKRCEEEGLDYEDYIDGCFTIINLFKFTKVPLSKTIISDTITLNKKETSLSLREVEEAIQEFYFNDFKDISINGENIVIELFSEKVIPINFIKNRLKSND